MTNNDIMRDIRQKGAEEVAKMISSNINVLNQLAKKIENPNKPDYFEEMAVDTLARVMISLCDIERMVKGLGK